MFSCSTAKRTYFTYKGIPLPTMGYSEESLSYMENEFQLLDDDVVTVSYPKSGTNWMLEILGLIWHDGDPSWVQSVFMANRSPWIETVDGLNVALNYPPPRFLTTHLPFQFFPKSFLHSKCKVSKNEVINQDSPLGPFPNVTSLAHLFIFHLCLGFAFPVMFGSWFDHVKGWMKLKERPNFFLITYEELQQDLRGSVKKICHFLGKELASHQLDEVTKYASFQIMKDNKMSNYSLLPSMDHSKGKFMRKGVCGDWKNHLTVAQSEHFDHVYQEKMQGVGVTFP
nr:sulfotransferase family cytosolic 2B member 1-like [Pogona vitticeps]